MIDEIRNLLIEFVPPVVLWAVYGVVLLIFAVVSVAITYHWKNYNVNSKMVRRLKKVYFLISGAFLFVMLVAVISYSL